MTQREKGFRTPRFSERGVYELYSIGFWVGEMFTLPTVHCVTLLIEPLFDQK